MISFKEIFKGELTWLSIQEVFVFIINYSILIIFTKLLNPEIFGTVALLNMYTGVFAVISSSGSDKFIIKNQVSGNLKLSALLINIMIFSFIIFIIALILLPIFLNSYLETTKTFFQYGFLSLLSIFTSVLYSFSRSLYIRDKQFLRMAKILIITNIISFILVILIGYFNRSVTSLLYKQIIAAILPSVILLYLSEFKFKLVFSRRLFLDFVTFTRFITLNNIFNYFVRNIDYFIIGKFFSTNIVGQYSIAYKVMVTPVKLVVKQIDTISFTTISKMNNHLDKIRLYYLDKISLIAQTIFPIIFSIIFFSDILVDIFFDSRYDNLSIIISILSISALFQSVTGLLGNIYIISNNTKLMFKLTVLLFILQSLVLLIGAKSSNIYLFCLSYTCAYIFINFTLQNYNALKPFKISIFDVLKKIVLPSIISILILGPIYFIIHKSNFNSLLNISIITLGLFSVYLIINRKIQNLFSL